MHWEKRSESSVRPPRATSPGALGRSGRDSETLARVRKIVNNDEDPRGEERGRGRGGEGMLEGPPEGKCVGERERKRKGGRDKEKWHNA